MVVSPNKRSGGGPHSKPFQPAPGNDFGPVEDVEAKTRDILTKAIIIAAGTALATTGVYGLFTGNFNVVIAI